MSPQSAYLGSLGVDSASDARVDLRLELFEIILASDRPGLSLTDHSQCLALSSSLRGKLCTQFAQLPPRHLRAGDHLYLMGNPAGSVFMVKSGLIKTSALSPEGQERTLRFYKPGDILGELCLCGGGRREEAVALEESTVTEIPLATMLGQLRRDPEIALDLACVVCDRLADAYEQVESLSWDSVLHRLVRTLIRLADDLGEESEMGVRLAHYIKQDELAQLVGARREVVSGLMSRLRASGHVSYTPRGPITIQRAALQAFLHGRARA